MSRNNKHQETPVRAALLDQLRSAITEGTFRPRDRLVERDLCERLGVSRTSLREALRQIEAEGLIDIIPHRGPVVREITADELLELWELRTAVERLVAQRFAIHGTEEDIQNLETSIAAMDDALRQQNRAAIKTTKRRLYESFAAGAHHSACAKLLSQWNARVSFLWSSSLLLRGRPAESIAELKSLLGAIKSRNSQAAQAAIVLHNEHAKAVALHALAAYETAKRAETVTSARSRKRAGRKHSPLADAAPVDAMRAAPLAPGLRAVKTAPEA